MRQPDPLVRAKMEAGWRSGTNPYVLLFNLSTARYQGLVGYPERRLRLLACACCRRIWHLLAAGRDRLVVEVVERHADGRATDDELHAAADAAEAAYRDAGGGQGDDLLSPNPLVHVARAVAYAAGRTPGGTFHRLCWYGLAALTADAVRAAVFSLSGEVGKDSQPTHDAEVAAHRALVRDVLGDPFRTPTIESAWLAWNDGAVRRLAEAIYAGRRFADLPILADALEEAGCADAALLDHLRGPGPHVPGCWALDLLLGKE